MAGNLKNFKLRGSCTVEMAMISGVWLLVIFASLLLVVGSMEKVINTADGVEAAVYGSGKAVSRIYDGVAEAKRKGQSTGKAYRVSGSKREITVSAENRLQIPFQNLEWEQSEVIKSKVVRPVLFIEKVQRARKIRDTFEG